MTIATPSYYQSMIVADKPIRYYPLGEAFGPTIVDASGANQNGTASSTGITYGGATLLPYTTRAGTAPTFDGNTGDISIPVSGLPTGNAPFSLEAWVSWSKLTSGNQICLGMGTWGTANTNAYLCVTSGGGLRAATYNDAYSTPIYGAGTLTLNTAYHVVGTWDGANMRLYVNGVLQGTGAAGTLAISEVAAYIANASETTLHDQWAGKVQHAAIYTYALTPTQVMNHYQAGAIGPTTRYAQVAGALVNIKQGSLNVQNAIGQRSTGGVQVWSALGVRWQYGTAIQLYNDQDALAFSGFISKDKASKGPAQQGQGYLEHALTLMDNAYRADKRVIFASYLQTSAGAIIKNIVQRILGAEGVTYTAQSIATGATISEVIWNGKQVSAALTWLAQQSGYWWAIDVNNVLWFQPYGGVVAPIVLDGTQVEAQHGLSVEYGNEMYVNSQYTKGAFSEKGPLTETFHGDGVRRSFTLAYPVSKVSQVVLNGTDVTANALTKGNNGGQFYYAVGDAVIAQDPSQTILSGTDTLTITYKGRYPVLAIAKNPNLIAAQKAREGTGSGIVENVYANTKVSTISAAFQIAGALLSHYGVDMTVLTFDTRQSGFMQGQSLKVNLPDFALNNQQMLISDITISDQTDGYNIWYLITAVGSPIEAAQWQTYWTNLMNQQSDPSDFADVSDTSLASLFATFMSRTPSFVVNPTKAVCAICSDTGMICGQWTVC